MEFSDFWGLHGPLNEPAAVTENYVFSSKNNLDLGLDVETQKDSIMIPPSSIVGLRRRSRDPFLQA